MSELITAIESRVSTRPGGPEKSQETLTLIKHIRLALVVHPELFTEVMDCVEGYVDKHSKRADNVKSYSIKNGIITIINGSILPNSKPFLPPWKMAELLGFKRGTKDFILATAYLTLPENRILLSILL